MIQRNVILLFITVIIATTAASPTKDLILGRKYVVPRETQAETYSLLKLTRQGTSVQQILYAIFTPIQAVVNVILNLMCSLVPSITAVVESLRSAVLENLISILRAITPVISVAAPEVGVVLEVVQLTLDSGNQLLFNGTVLLQQYGCRTILSINDVVSSIANSIIGSF